MKKERKTGTAPAKNSHENRTCHHSTRAAVAEVKETDKDPTFKKLPLLSWDRKTDLLHADVCQDWERDGEAERQSSN